MSKTETNNVRVQYAEGVNGKTVVARILPGTDLLTGIEEICRKHDVKYAAIPNCFGSFERAGYLYLVPQKSSKIGAGYGDLNRAEGPVEFLSGTGVVCQRDGEYDIHFHATMCDKEGTVFGGHIVKGENPVLTTVDIVLTEVRDVDMYRTYDEETDLIQFNPKK